MSAAKNESLETISADYWGKVRGKTSQMASDAVGVTYHRLHHFLTEAPWSAMQVNEHRLYQFH